MKFKDLLKKGPEDIRDARREMLVEVAEEAQYEIVKAIKRQVRNLEKNLLSLEWCLALSYMIQMDLLQDTLVLFKI